jgi:hypothetical protein
MCCFLTAGKHINNTQAIARQLLSKWVPMAMDTHAMVKVLLDYNNGNHVFWGSCQNGISRVSEVLEEELSAVQFSEVT